MSRALAGNPEIRSLWVTPNVEAKDLEQPKLWAQGCEEEEYPRLIYLIVRINQLYNLKYVTEWLFEKKYAGSITGVTNLTWYSGNDWTIPPYGYKNVIINNFMMEIIGYYKAPLTGIYTLTAEVDDSVTVFIGSGEAFECGVIRRFDELSEYGSAVYKLTNFTIMNTTMLNSYNEEVIITYNEVIPAPITTTSHIVGSISSTTTKTNYFIHSRKQNISGETKNLGDKPVNLLKPTSSGFQIQ
ncbi:hypothetical protein RI543_000385 [Arxiozyma heterogenica]|uniref:PA14 domain-containing protein n=1 Tax=Arxiozyma heterogenica TaxID=278026 RepID=A0AAN7WNG7_9SACH|nr:hypothetical protein RI543_000385 [Kazachstania heterogenica]